MKSKPEFELAKKLTGRSQMDRVRAARAYLNQAGPQGYDRQVDLELHAFMALFHPEFPTDKVREMSRDMRRTPIARARGRS